MTICIKKKTIAGLKHPAIVFPMLFSLLKTFDFLFARIFIVREDFRFYHTFTVTDKDLLYQSVLG